MHPALLYTARYGPEIAEWLFANRDRIGSGFQRFGEPIFDSLSGRSQGIGRIGNVIVAQRDGHREVIGLLHRQESKIDGIGRAVDGVAEAVDGLAAGQAGLAASLDLLTSLSAVTLGVSVLAPAILLLQFHAVHRRLDGISSDVRAIQDRLEIKDASDLDAGLTFLSNAGPTGHSSGDAKAAALISANNELTRSRSFYARLLAFEIAKGSAANPKVWWLLARHLTVATLGLAACHLQQGDVGLTREALRRTIPALRDHAAAVFGRTVGADPSPMRFLMPAMKEHGVTLESLAELYRRSVAEFFEEHLRGHSVPSRNPGFSKRRQCSGCGVNGSRPRPRSRRSTASAASSSPSAIA